MARIRSIKPEYWVSEQVVECSPIARLLFIGMWSFCDDAGVHPASYKTLKMEVFPGDDISCQEIEQLVGELLRAGLLESYVVDSKSYFKVTGWHHQKIEKPNFRYPDKTGCVPVGNKSSNGRRLVDEELTPEGKGEESKGVEGNKQQANACLSADADADDADEDQDETIPNCPHGEIIRLYNEILAANGLPAVKPNLWDGQRATHLRRRWQEDEKRQSLNWWRKFFEFVSKSDFLMGRKSDFSADLGWLVKHSNFVKVCEGKYRNA